MQMSNITFCVNDLKDLSLGAEVMLPECIKSNHRLVNVSGDGNLYFFNV